MRPRKYTIGRHKQRVTTAPLAIILRSLSAALLAATALGLVATTISAQNLTSLPHYKPASDVSGVVRIFGSDLGGMVKVWEDGFRKYQTSVRFDDSFPSSDGATAGLISGVADIGSSGREPVLTEFLSFNETFKYDLQTVAVATGAYDIKGKTWAVVVFVNKDNPLTKLTIKQLDGIFGTERTGGYEGYKWTNRAARTAAEDIRTWGQLGLTGEWADKPIHTYGYANTGMTNFFQLKVFNGGEKWNPNYREYVESETKMVTDESGSSYHMLAEISDDKYGIAWSGIPHAKGFPKLKPLALAWDQQATYVEPTRDSVQNGSYPLTRSIFMYIKHPPGQSVDLKVKEFLRYILSQEGQQDVARQKVYLPLTAAATQEQLKKIE
jgi:phosphate transport system substrate-binding protein